MIHIWITVMDIWRKYTIKSSTFYSFQKELLTSNSHLQKSKMYGSFTNKIYLQIRFIDFHNWIQPKELHIFQGNVESSHEVES